METQSVRIRTASASDPDLLASLIRTAFATVARRFGITPENAPRHPSNCTSEWVSRDMERGVTYYILDHDGMPVGCAAVEEAPDGICYLERLAVLPAHRNKGFGRALVNTVVLKAKTLGAHELGIGIIDAHTELKEWYLRLGFVETQTRDYAHLPFRVCLPRLPLAGPDG
jgi:N-acetylglutamate synthase-like GNAT family acetyltransferase